MFKVEDYCLYCCHKKGRKEGCDICGPEALGKAFESSHIHLSPGSILENKYLIGRVLGVGGYGITYLGVDFTLNRRVAVKEFMPKELVSRTGDSANVIPFSEKAANDFQFCIQKFNEEGRVLAQFSKNPNIVSVLDFFQSNNTAYIVMEYIEGVRLNQYLDSAEIRMTEEDVLLWSSQIMDGLKAIHNKGILHRDIKPENIYLGHDGVAKIIDFGATRRAVGELSGDVSKTVSDGYSPIEQYSLNAVEGAWTDIYALGATMYHMLSGSVPPSAPERLSNDILIPLNQLPGLTVSGKTSDCISNAMEMEPGQRFYSIDEMVSELRRAPNIVNPQPDYVPPLVPKPSSLLEPHPEVGESSSPNDVAKWVGIVLITLIVCATAIFVVTKIDMGNLFKNTPKPKRVGKVTKLKTPVPAPLRPRAKAMVGRNLYIHNINDINVRNAPSKNGTRIGKACYGDMAYIKEWTPSQSNPDFTYFKISTRSGGLQGWAYAGDDLDWFKSYAPPSPKVRKIGRTYRCCYNKVGYVNLRSRPSTKSNVIHEIKNGERVKILGSAKSETSPCAHFYKVRTSSGFIGYTFFGTINDWFR